VDLLCRKCIRGSNKLKGLDYGNLFSGFQNSVPGDRHPGLFWPEADYPGTSFSPDVMEPKTTREILKNNIGTSGVKFWPISNIGTSGAEIILEAKVNYNIGTYPLRITRKI
jgi:hypothetical protein